VSGGFAGDPVLRNSVTSEEREVIVLLVGPAVSVAVVVLSRNVGDTIEEKPGSWQQKDRSSPKLWPLVSAKCTYKSILLGLPQYLFRKVSYGQQAEAGQLRLEWHEGYCFDNRATLRDCGFSASVDHILGVNA
jgi:hypothetical protein